jgi:hypothetical protein
MEFKGTKDFSLFVYNTSILIDGKYTRGYCANISYRDSGILCLALTGQSYEIVVIQANRACADLQIEREQRIQVHQAKQLGMLGQ